MSTSENFDDVEDDGSWKKLMDEVKAATDNESQMESRLTATVVLGPFRNRLFDESTGKKKEKEKRLFTEEKGIESRPGTISGPRSLEEGDKEEEYVMRKHKKQKTVNVEKKKKQQQKQKQNAGNGRKQKQKKKDDVLAKLTELGLVPPPDMPEAFKNCIVNLGGTDVKLVLQKFIEKTDLSRQHNRLSMSRKSSNTFLSEAEERILKPGIDVTFVEPSLEVSELHLTEWKIGTSDCYVLNNQWNQVVKNNTDSLKPKAVVQIWSFRTPPNSKLGLAMIKVRDGEDGNRID